MGNRCRSRCRKWPCRLCCRKTRSSLHDKADQRASRAGPGRGRGADLYARYSEHRRPRIGTRSSYRGGFVNRYALWKYVVIVIALVLGAIYTLPNFYGESPAVQVSSGRQTVKVDAPLMARVETILSEAKIPHEAVYFDTIGTNSTVRMRFADTDTQLKAKDILQKALNPDAEDPAYVVALNLISNTPRWLVGLRALPMYLG